MKRTEKRQISIIAAINKLVRSEGMDRDAIIALNSEDARPINLVREIVPGEEFEGAVYLHAIGNYKTEAAGRLAAALAIGKTYQNAKQLIRGYLQFPTDNLKEDIVNRFRVILASIEAMEG